LPRGGLIASGNHLIAIRNKFIQRLSINTCVVAALGWGEVRFIKPGRPGDHLTLFAECIEKRVSKLRFDCGIVKGRYELINQNNEIAMSLTDTLLVRKWSA